MKYWSSALTTGSYFGVWEESGTQANLRGISTENLAKCLGAVQYNKSALTAADWFCVWNDTDKLVGSINKTNMLAALGFAFGSFANGAGKVDGIQFNMWDDSSNQLGIDIIFYGHKTLSGTIYQDDMVLSLGYDNISFWRHWGTDSNMARCWGIISSGFSTASVTKTFIGDNDRY